MEPHEIFERYRELQEYVGWNDDDVRRVMAAFPYVQPYLPELVEDFYREIDRHPRARKVITGGEEQVLRLKGKLSSWLEQLFQGVYDEPYVLHRWQAGWRHVEIGLDQVFANVALSRLRDGLVGLLIELWRGDPDERGRTIRSLNKLLDLDLAIIEDAYQVEHLKREQQVERLAALGQISGGVAHELRNPLNVIKTSVYYLLNAKNLTSEKTSEHLRRIERQVEVADAVTMALADFAKLPLPQLRPLDVSTCVREVIDLTVLPENISVDVALDPALPKMLADQQQLHMVFGNLVRNARDAMPDGGNLSVTATYDDSFVNVAVTDTGIGIREEDLKRIYEPLYSTKARGMGLGLAICRTILDKHGAHLDVTSQPGGGSRFVVSVPATREGEGR